MSKIKMPADVAAAKSLLPWFADVRLLKASHGREQRKQAVLILLKGLLILRLHPCDLVTYQRPHLQVYLQGLGFNRWWGQRMGHKIYRSGGTNRLFIHVARSYNNSILNFLRNGCTVFHCGCTILRSHQQCKDSNFTSLSTLIIFFYWQPSCLV